MTEFSQTEHGGCFKIGAAPETLQKTNLGQLKPGDKVNCERAMAAHTRFGGHFVQVRLLAKISVLFGRRD